MAVDVQEGRRRCGEKIDLVELLDLYPSLLAEHVKIREVTGKEDGGENNKGRRQASVDWRNGRSVRAVTAATLHHWYGIVDWSIPEGCLCPAVPNRKNYIDWLHHILETSTCREQDGVCRSLDSDNIKKKDVNVMGLDIGTGASCIYPLIGTCEYGWKFVGTDISDEAIQSARSIVARNEHTLQGRVQIRDARSYYLQRKVVRVDDTYGKRPQHNDDKPNDYGIPIMTSVICDYESFDFMMCNPPFFEDMTDLHTRPKRKRKLPPDFVSAEAKTVLQEQKDVRNDQNPRTCHSHGGSGREVITAGGEAAFVERIVNESFVLKEKISWYTSMFGKKATWLYINSILKRNVDVHKIACIRTTVLTQGKTYRWVIAWSFSHVSDIPCAIREAKNKKKLLRKDKRKHKL